MSAKEFFLTFFVITEPAPIILFSFKVTGATNDEFEPTKTLCLIIVLFLFFPSQLQLIVPALILTKLPISASPI